MPFNFLSLYTVVWIQIDFIHECFYSIAAERFIIPMLIMNFDPS